jgi:hypothetical protein
VLNPIEFFWSSFFSHTITTTRSVFFSGDLPAAEQQQVQVDEKPSAGELPETVTTHHFAMVRVESLLDEGEAVLAEPPLELDQVAKNPRLVLEPLLSVVFLLFIFKYF